MDSQFFSFYAKIANHIMKDKTLHYFKEELKMDENNEMTMVETTTPEVTSETSYEEGPSVAVVGLVGAGIGALALFLGQKAYKGIKGLFKKNKDTKEKPTVESEASEVTDEEK